MVENVSHVCAFENENKANFGRVAKDQALAQEAVKTHCSRVRTSTIIRELRLCLGGDLLVDASEPQLMLDKILAASFQSGCAEFVR